MPATNPARWSAKFRANEARDKRNMNDLLAAGWRVIVLWECGLRGSDLHSRLDWLPKAIKNWKSSCHFQKTTAPINET